LMARVFPASEVCRQVAVVRWSRWRRASWMSRVGAPAVLSQAAEHEFLGRRTRVGVEGVAEGGGGLEV
jgi:hypothetical protein